jgi:hypothetical protein
MIPFLLNYGIGIALACYGFFLFPRALEKVVATGKMDRTQAARVRRIAFIGSWVLLVLTAVRFFLAVRG